MTRQEIVRWWESRRLRYNLWVGLVGLASWLAVGFAGSAAVQPGEDFEEPIAMIFGPFLYALLANACYTLGWLADITAYRGTPREWLFNAGLAFSLMLTSLPGLWAIAAWMWTVVTGHKLPSTP